MVASPMHRRSQPARRHEHAGRNTNTIPWRTRDLLPMPGEVEVLTRLATEPSNCKRSKPARFILMYTAGRRRKFCAR